MKLSIKLIIILATILFFISIHNFGNSGIFDNTGNYYIIGKEVADKFKKALNLSKTEYFSIEEINPEIVPLPTKILIQYKIQKIKHAIISPNNKYDYAYLYSPNKLSEYSKFKFYTRFYGARLISLVIHYPAEENTLKLKILPKIKKVFLYYNIVWLKI